jgi:hypothetical protein
MRRTVWIAFAAACGGSVVAGVGAYATTRGNIWQMNGPEFRLGYVIGYLDAVTLAQRRDQRATVPVIGKTMFDRYVKGVDAYLADPANAGRTVPDAMAAVGNKIREEWMLEWSRRTRRSPSPSPSAGP